MNKEHIEIFRKYIVSSHYRVQQYEQIFMGSENHSKMIYEIAGNFFNDLKAMYWEIFILDLSRLTDPAEQGNDKNLSLDYIVNILLNCVKGIDKELILKLNSEILEEVYNIRELRKKTIAHKDRKTSENKLYLTNSGVKIHDIKSIYEKIGKILNEYYFSTEKTTWWFTPTSRGGVDQLIWCLQDGMIYRNIKKERFSEINQDGLKGWQIDKIEKDNCEYGNL